MDLHPSDLPGLDFRPGTGVQSAILERFGSPVNFKPASGQSEFILVASIGRCAYRLNEETVGFILQATIGGIAADFRTSQLDDRLFRFSVSSKQVGLHIYNLQSYECKQYKLYFHLWGAGGAHWSKESKDYNQEEAASWQTVTHRKRRSYADTVRYSANNKVQLTGANAVPISHQERQRPLRHRSSVFSRLTAAAEAPRPSVFQRISQAEDPIEDITAPRHGEQNKGKAPIMESGNGQSGVQNSNSNGPSNQRSGGPQYRIVRDNRAHRQPTPTSQMPEGAKRNADQKVTVCGYTVVICSKCLQSGHASVNCVGRVKCRNCHKLGHIRAICRSRPNRGGFTVEIRGQSKALGPYWPAGIETSWFRQPIIKPCSSKPPCFGSIQEMGKDFIALSTVHRASSPSNACTLLQLSLPNPDSTFPSNNRIVQGSCETLPPQANAAAMAYRRSDPAPFLPRGFHRLQVNGRDTAVRAVAARPQLRNEDVAIVLIDGMPQNEVPFANIREVLHEFLIDYKRLAIKDIQPCHLGQAYVRFAHPHDRDNLADSGALPYGNIEFRFVRHNEGRNRRAVNFNRECWLMLLGFPLDYWHLHYIENAISSFGRLTGWYNDPSNLARVLVCARVTDLVDVPEFIVLTEGEGFQGFSWTIQVEILQQNMTGVLPPDEEPLPPFNDGHAPIIYDFFGFGQEGAAPFEPDPEPEPAQDEQNNGQPWAPWNAEAELDAAPAVNENAAVGEIDLNVEPVVQEIEEQMIDQEDLPDGIIVQAPQLAQAPQVANVEQPVDPQAHVVPGEAFIELADFVNELMNDDQQNSEVLSGNAPGNSGGSINQQIQNLHNEVDNEVEQPANLLEHAEPGGDDVILALEAALDAPVAFIAEDVQMNELVELNDFVDEPEQDMQIDLNLPPLLDMQNDILVGVQDQPMQVQLAQHQVQLEPNNQVLQEVQPHQPLLLQQEVAHHHEEEMDNDQHQNIHVGYMMQQQYEGGDPIFQNMQSNASLTPKLHPDVYRLWAKHFEPVGNPDVIITIPKRWAAFFTKQLLNPAGFEWAREFLLSQAWQVLGEDGDEKLKYTLPSICPSAAAPACDDQQQNFSEEAPNDNQLASVTEDLPPTTPPEVQPAFHSAKSTSEIHEKKKKRCMPAPLVTSEVRRSTRIKDKLKGFKSNKCDANGCYACSSAPPNLSPSMIKNLGHTFCKISLDELSEPKLTAKRKMKTTVAVEVNSNTEQAGGSKALKTKKAIAKKAVKKPTKGDPNEDKKNKRTKK
ncbi:hypothetical protein EJB05_49921, partial [Eragrostis curvula]